MEQTGLQVRSAGPAGWLWRVRWIVVALSLVGLLASNIASVLHAGFHDWLYAGARKVLLIAGESLADAATRRSKAVEAERKIREQTADLRKQTVDAEARRARAEADGGCS